MSVVLRRHTAERLFGIIAPMEEQCRFARQLRRFRKSGPWLLSESYLNRVLLAPSKYHDAFPGLKLGSSAAGRGVLLWRRCIGRVVEVCSAADAVRVKSNLRSFYTRETPRVAAKLVIEDNAKRIDGIRNEVDVRSQVQAFGCLQVPAIIAHQLEGASPWYTEQLIAGRTAAATDAPLVAKALLPGLLAMYRRFGIAWKPSPIVDREQFYRQLQAAMGRVAWQRAWMPPQQFLKQVRELQANEAVMPFSKCHGDLSPTNVIITPGNDVYLIDWETADERPLMHDLSALLLNFPLPRQQLYHALSELADDAETPGMSPIVQHGLALLFRIVFWERKIQRGAGIRQRTLRSEYKRLFSAANALFASDCQRSGTRRDSV